MAIKLDAGTRSVEARLRDLSLGGMFIETSLVLPYGQEITIALNLPALEYPAEIPCVVRWCKPDGVGVAFGALRAAETWAINQLAALHETDV